MNDIINLFQGKNPLIGLLIAIIAAIAVRWLDKTIRQRSDYFVEASKIREELRKQVDTNTSRIAELEAQVEELHQKYWEEVEAHAKTKAELYKHIVTEE